LYRDGLNISLAKKVKKMKSTNYFNTFIEIAEDCPATVGEIPPIKGDKKTVANLQFEMLSEHPYEYTSDDVLFSVFATRKEIANKEDRGEQRTVFFSKGQPCFRSSPLTKRYGWGIHSNEEGKIAIYGVESEEYQRFVAEKSIIKKKAMRSKRA
jgi:hypothetical protein